MGYSVDLILGQVFSGLMRAFFLCLVTAGLTLIYGVMSVLNVAHVSFYMLGAYFTCTFWRLLQASNFSYWVSIPLTCATMGLIGLLVELVLMRRLYRRIQAEMLVATYALIYILGDLAKMTWGLRTHSIIKPVVLTRPIATIGSASFPASVAFSGGVTALVMLGVWFWLHRTRFGRVVRAVQSDREMVGALGIHVPRVYTAVFTASTVLAGLAGAVWVATGAVERGMLDVAMLPQVFCVMVTGGMGSFAGTAVAALILGEAYALSILVAAKAAMISLYVVTAVILLARPWGLLGTRGRLE